MRAEKVYARLEKHQTWLILTFRFFYGIRNITPLVIGMSRVPVRRYVILNTIGAALWSLSFSFGGYVFGAALETFLKKEHQMVLILLLIALTVLLWVIRMARRRTIQKNNLLPPSG